MQTDPFQSPESFRQTFENGLARMLDEYDELGVFILVLANAAFDPEIQQRLRVALKRKFDRLSHLHETAGGDASVLGAPDDLAVFQQLLRLGIDDLLPVAVRDAGVWELQFNQLRSFRPLRNAGSAEPGICKPFNPAGFHFARPFLAKETIWRGAICGRDCTLFYNKFPFATLHGLLVLEVDQGLPQYIRPQDMASLWEITLELGRGLPGIGFGYSSTGAYSSVNHLHFQSFVRERPLPVEDGRWTHQGGEVAYPVACEVFDELNDIQYRIAELHEQEIGYNLLLRPGRCYCLTRAWQGTVAIPEWTAGLAWYELAGGFVCFDPAGYERLAEEDLSAALALLRV